jgi:hypothetical protein
MAVINGANVLELRENFQESIQDGGPRATKSFLCDWAFRYQVANGLMGLATHSGTSISFTSPNVYPESPNLVASTITIRGIGGQYDGPRQIAFDRAVITVQYGVVPFGTLPGSDPGGLNSFDAATPLVYCTQELDFGYMAVPLPRGQVKANSLPVDGHPAVRNLAVVTMRLTLYRMPYLISASVRQKAGKLNSGTFLGCTAGMLRFDGVKTHRDGQSDGSLAQTTNIGFSYRPEQPWNYVPDPGGSSTWYPALYADGATTIPKVSFDDIIPTAYYG